MPKTRTDKFELSFANNKSLWKRIDEDENNADEASGGGMQIRMMTAGQNDIVFHDLTGARKIEQREMFDKNYIITDTIAKLDWKLTGETQKILGHVCQRAVAQRVGTRTAMAMTNGTLEKKEITDTTNIVAWFTSDIPVSVGPDLQGQLPGLILELDIDNGRTVYKALEISPKVDVASIKEPSKGKKVTASEFANERVKMMSEMQKNNQGRNSFFVN
jgi:GLPGLI family protein